MRRRAGELAVALVAITLSACAHHTAIGDAVAFPAPGAVSPAHVRGAVLTGLASRRFVPEGEEPGSIIAAWTTRSLWLRVRVYYSAERYAIEYVASGGLGERIDPDGTRWIHSRYHRYVDRLRRSIDEGFANPMMTAGGAMPAPPPPAPAAPPQAGGAGEAVPLSPGSVGADVAPAPNPAAAAELISPPVDPNVASTESGAGAQLVPPPPDSLAPSPPPAAPVQQALPPPLTGPLAAPEAPPSAPIERSRRPTHPLWELAGTGIAILAGSWVANWGAGVGVGGSDDAYIGLSFLPVAGPWAQLPTLEWTIHPRWTGLFHPVMGVLQLAGLAMMVAGLVIPVPDEATSADDHATRWMLMPTASEDGAGLTFGMQL